MANSKSSKDKSKVDETVQDAAKSESPKVEPDQVADAVIVVEEPTEADEVTVDEAEAKENVTPADDAAPVDATPVVEAPHKDPELEADIAEASPHSDPASGAKPETVAVPVAPQVIRETVVQKRAGFLPTLIGGAIAASAGFLAAQYESDDWPFGVSADDPFRAQTEAALQSQQGAVDALTVRVGAAEGAVAELDLSGAEARIEALAGQVKVMSEDAASMADKIGLLEVRLVALEKAPIAETVSPEAIAAYERELDALRADITQQRAEIKTMATDAMAAEENATAQAELAKARAAMAELTTALENGKPFADAIATISATTDVAIADVLKAASSDGIATQSVLATGFADTAREALSAARAAGTAEQGTGRLTSFLRDQLGARSVTPREGGDPDAVLSRAEASVKSGDLAAALSEIGTLPEEAQTALAGWVAQAQLRVHALDAADALSQELNKK